MASSTHAHISSIYVILDYFKDKIQGLTTTLTTHMTSQEATSLGVPEEAEIGVWRVILITAVVLVLMGAFALLVWRRRVLQKRRHKTQNGISVAIFLIAKNLNIFAG